MKVYTVLTIDVFNLNALRNLVLLKDDNINHILQRNLRYVNSTIQAIDIITDIAKKGYISICDDDDINSVLSSCYTIQEEYLEELSINDIDFDRVGSVYISYRITEMESDIEIKEDILSLTNWMQDNPSRNILVRSHSIALAIDEEDDEEE